MWDRACGNSFSVRRLVALELKLGRFDSATVRNGINQILLTHARL